MKTKLITATRAVATLALSSSPVLARGCLTGAAVGAVAGHFAPHLGREVGRIVANVRGP